MNNNTYLNIAKTAKKDEFYTLMSVIELEVSNYIENNPDLFRGKTILLPCDNPYKSNFTKYFIQNFKKFELKKLISTCIAENPQPERTSGELYTPSLLDDDFDSQNPTNKSETKGKILVLTENDFYNENCFDWNSLSEKVHCLDGSGDFRSDEITKLRDEADFIITNPPFSLFRDFFQWIVPKKFLVLGNVNAITYKEIFLYLKRNEFWFGVTNFNTGMYFEVPDTFSYSDNCSFHKFHNENKICRVRAVCWFTNIEHGKKPTGLTLMTMKNNLKYSKHDKIRKFGYQKYDGQDIIDVPFTDAVPKDYTGVMGVPITFFKYFDSSDCEIVGIANHGKDSEFDLFVPRINGKAIFKRILIKWRKNLPV